MREMTETITGTRIYREWVRRLDSGVLTRGQIGQWCNAIYPLAGGWFPGGARTNMTESEAQSLVSKLASAGGVGLTPEHERFGREWLARNLARVAERFPDAGGFDMSMFRGFRFIGVSTHDSGGLRASHAPRYTVVSEDAQHTFTYHWAWWGADHYGY